MKTTMRDLYAVLGVRSDADSTTIRKAYRACVRHAHPDRRPPEHAARAHEEMALINLAYETLSDPRKRAEYDAQRLRMQGATGGSRTTATAGSRPRRVVVMTPKYVHFGTVRVGQRAPERAITLRFFDRSRIVKARIVDESGWFWSTGPGTYSNVTSVTIRIFGRSIAADTEPTEYADVLRVQLDEVLVRVHLVMTVEGAPADPAPMSPVVPMPPPRRRSGVRLSPVSLVLTALMAVIAIVGVALFVSGHLGHRVTSSGRLAPPLATAGAPPSKYCSVSTDGGQMLSFYLTRPGVAKQAAVGKDPIWSVMAPAKGDSYLSWWTPAFPYWERVNYGGFTDDAGTTHSPLTYAEVLPYADVPWLPLTDVFERYPELNASAEAVQRKLFLGRWIKELNSPRCA